MALKEKLHEDLLESLKGKKELAVSVLRLLLAAILNKEKEKRYKLSKEKPELSEDKLAKNSELTNGEIIEVIAYEVKKRKEAQAEFERGKRSDLAEKEKKEAEILLKYLPEQLAKEEIEKIAKEVINKIGAKGIKDMGRVMKEIMPKVKGRAEGGLVSQIIKDKLTEDDKK